MCSSDLQAFTYTLKSNDSGSFLFMVELIPPGASAPSVDFGEGFLDVDKVSVSGPIEPPTTPHIFFAGPKGLVDTFDNPQTVAVGEPVQLIILPEAAAGHSQKWAVSPPPRATNGFGS